MSTRYEKLKTTAPYLFWTALAVITFLLLMEVSPSESRIPHADKIIHATLFLILSSLGALAFPKQISITFVSLALYAGLTEVLQHLLTVTRHASLLDWMADITGILLCASAIYLFGKQKTT